jgi:hypothetical protein
MILLLGRTVGVVQSWYAKGLHHHPGEWKFTQPPSEEDKSWTELKQELKKDRSFRNLKVNLTTNKHIYWVSGDVASESDYDRLIVLSAKCGIKGRNLDGPYAHSISISYPGSERSKPIAE